MFTPQAKLRTAATAATMAAALIGLGAGAANAADWPPLQEGAYLYSGTNGTGTVTEVDLGDVGTCHTLAQSVRSVQIVDGSASVVLYTGTGCTGSTWASGTLAQSNLSVARLSYRVVPA
ncbi:hypothetical protein GCM10010129_78340 [Streptomyces fumigatiscleroticus]|nr:hypothetical protein GCM10010129_78340 [Streptomyces fumigatiscleroticus]